jgi:hypothetical protein
MPVAIDMTHPKHQDKSADLHYGGFQREADMLIPIATHRKRLLPKSMADWEIFFEIQTLHGIVDILFVIPETETIAQRESSGISAVTDTAQVATLMGLTALRAIRGQAATGATASSLKSFVPVSPAHLKRRILPGLAASGWVEKLGDETWVVRCEYKIPLRKIIAIEVKRGEWRRALNQAAPHTHFADAAFVALDAVRVPSLDRLEPAFSHAGVGLITVANWAPRSASSGLDIMIRPQYHARSGLSRAVVAERVVALRATGMPSGPVGHVFGKFITTSVGTGDPRMESFRAND